MPTTYAIPNGRTVFDATTYTGNGATNPSSQDIINAAGFKPDMVWIKSRSNAYPNFLWDSIRGVANDAYLVTNDTSAQNSDATGNQLSSFNSNGFSVQNTTGGSVGTNGNGSTFVGWQWQAGQGSNVTNTTGTITSTVSANVTAGFSIVTWTGNGVSSATVGHGLGVQPAMVIAKCRSATNDWSVTHQGIPNSFIYLNSTGAAATGGGTNGAMNYQSTYTSSVFGFLAGSSTVNNVNANGSTYVAYCWSEVAGFSKFGSYTGNANADGPFVYTGFRPKFILIKNVDNGVADWVIWDSSRNTYNLTNAELNPDLSAAESAYNTADFLSNGFKLRSTYGNTNGNGQVMVYAAFAENPFKYANAR